MAVEYPPNCQPVVNTGSTSDLVKRLKALSEALQNSETNDEAKAPDRYRSLATHLSEKSFLDTTSREVQIWLACCLADIFRLFAPQIPFGDPTQLREVLIFMIRSLKGLESPSGPLFRRYFYLLENMYACNTLQLTLELPGEEACSVIKHLIRVTMDIVNGKEWTKERESSEEGDRAESVDSENTDRSDRKEKMHHLLLSSITKLLGEVDQITIPVLDAIFFYLINPQKSNNRESYYMARNIIQGANTSLDGPVENLLTRSLLVGGFLEECEMVGAARQKLYDVIIELHEAMPSLVVPVIPQVGNFLKDPDLESRLAAVKAVSVMVQNPKSRLYEDYPDVWEAYLERRRDANVSIRSMFAKKALHILLNNSQLRGPICDAICRLLNDPEEQVRSDALSSAYEAAKRKLDSVNEGLITACCEKMCDAKSQIRQDAISKLLQLHSKVIMGEEYTVSDRQVVSVIPTYAFRLYLKPETGRHEKMKIERLFSASIVPYKLETEKRIRWMVELHEKLGRIEGDSLVSIVLRNAAYRRLTREILFVIKSEMENEKKGLEIDSRIERMAREQPSPTSFTHIFRKLTNLLSEDQKTFESLYHTVGSDYTCTRVGEAVSGFLGSVIESKKFTKDETTVVRHFVERVAPLILDKDGAEILVQIVIKADGDFTCKKTDSELRLAKVLQLLNTWADAYPHAFSSKSVVDKLMKLLGSDNHKTVEVVLSVFLHIGFQQKSREIAAEWMDDVTSVVWDLVVTEQPNFGRVAKIAVRVLCKFEFMKDLIGKEGKLLAVADTLVQRLDIDHPACENAIRALSVIQLACQEDFHAHFPDLIPTIIVPLVLSGDSDPGDPQIVDLYVEDMNKLKMPKYTAIKEHAMKFLARSLTGHADQDALAVKTMKLFVSFIEGSGSVHNDELNISPLECVALRATAGACVLRMSYLPKYLKMLTPEKFLILSSLMTDSADCVRRHFVDRLYKGIRKNKLVVEFIALFALPALLRNGSDEEHIRRYIDECRTRVKMGVLRRTQTLKLMKLPPGNLPFFQPEYAVAYSTFLLAMQPILTSHKDVDNLAYLQECMWFIMEPFVQNKTQFDFELMYRSLQEVRQSKSVCAFEKLRLSEISNKEYEETNMKMWALADLALCMMVYRAKIEIKNLPGETMLVKFFKKMRETNDPVYAPEELIKAEQERQGKAPRERKGWNGTTTNATRANRTKKERAPVAKKTAATRKPAQKKPVIVEDDEESEESDDEQEEVMPAPSRRRGPATKASTSNGSPLAETKSPKKKEEKKEALEGELAAPKGRGSALVESPRSMKKRSHAVTIASTSEAKSAEEPADKKTRLSLENLPFSPIVRDPAMPKRGTRGFVSSTPIARNGGAPRSGRRTIEKLEEVDEGDEDAEKEEEEREPKRRGRSSRLTAGASPSKPTAAKSNGVPDSDEEEEAEEEKKPIKKRGGRTSKKEDSPAKSGASSVAGKRGPKKNEAKKPASDSEDDDEEKEEVVEKKASPKKTIAKKTTSAKGAKKTTRSQESEDEEEPPKKTRRTNESQKTETDDDEAAEEKKKPVGRGRGRPRKSSSVVTDDEEEKKMKSPGRGRGRPRKSSSVVTDDEEEKMKKSPGRGRGRPRKSSSVVTDDEEEKKRKSPGRGRPRKTSVVTDDEEEKKEPKSPKKSAGGRKTAARKSSPVKKEEEEKKTVAGRRGAKKNEAPSSPAKKTAGRKGAAADAKKERKGSEAKEEAADEKPKRGRPAKNAEPAAPRPRSTRLSQDSEPSSPAKAAPARKSRKKIF